MKMLPAENGKANNGEQDAVHMSWDAAQAAAASGSLVVAAPDGERGDDLQAAQSPAPGTDPVGGKEAAAPGDVLTNVAPVMGVGAVARSTPPDPPPPAKIEKAAEPRGADKGVEPKGDAKV